MLSSKIENIELSGTMEVSAKTFELRSKGIDVIDLCVGEPDLPTPENIKKAGINAIDHDKTKYTINTGIKELRQAIADKYKNEWGIDFSIDEIIVSNGAKQSIYNVLQTIINENEEVLIPAPYYVSYPHMVKLAGGKPVIVETKRINQYKPTIDEIASYISPKSKAIILCNPNNPTGTVLTKKELETIVNFSIEKNLVVICDEIYEKLIYNKTEFTSVASFGKKENVIIINGVSKTYSMTGWRIGYAIGSKNIVSGMNKLQSHSTSNACTISQFASLEALTGDQALVEQQRIIFEERRNLVYNALKEIELFSCVEPKGAFYIFVDIKKVLEKSDKITDSEEFCMKLLNEAYVATVPGSVFGKAGYIRISYAKSNKELTEAMIRLKEFVNTII